MEPIVSISESGRGVTFKLLEVLQNEMMGKAYFQTWQWNRVFGTMEYLCYFSLPNYAD